VATDRTSITHSCLVDRPVLIQQQAHRLVASLLDSGVAPDAIVVHVAADPLPAFAAWLRDRRVDTVRVEPFGHVYCNKLQQLRTFQARSGGHVVLLDCDLFVTRPVDWPRPATVAAKPVDVANPPASVLRGVFRAAGLKPRWTTSDLLPAAEGRDTVVGNCNGGVFVIARDFLPALAESWTRWARWCLDDGGRRLDPFAMHVDQVAFALAVSELGVAPEVLDRTLNFPTHLATLPDDVDCSPLVLHYHRHVDDQLLLRPTGLFRVDQSVRAANERIVRWRADEPLGPLFFGARYELFPALDPDLDGKQRLLRRLLADEADASVLDVGCGDGRATGSLTLRDYVGVDLTPNAIDAARAERPDWTYRIGDALDAGCEIAPADVVLCLDVLVHQSTADAYEGLVRRLAGLTRRMLVLSGYDDAPVLASTITHYHEPLTTTLARTGDFDEITVVGGYGDATVVVARRRGRAHPRDMAGYDVTAMSDLVDDPLLFRQMVDLARSTIGFFPAHNPRAIEYTWVAARLGEALHGHSILDVGAGVNPLPLWFARRGARVTTIDDHTIVRTPDGDRGSWNEWGFLDYGVLQPGVVSIHEAFEDVAPNASHDAVVCVSVIEHLPAALRRSWIERFALHLRPGGALLLTVDLIPWSERLWCMREGRLVEDASRHGTVDDLVAELRSGNFCVTATRVFRRVPRSRVGIALVEARLSSPPRTRSRTGTG
jgi:2-polyprenyl-3-methyl-5-hydroxy-6-metoxy-1,4-benzoquinol methylase